MDQAVSHIHIQHQTAVPIYDANAGVKSIKTDFWNMLDTALKQLLKDLGKDRTDAGWIRYVCH